MDSEIPTEASLKKHWTENAMSGIPDGPKASLLGVRYFVKATKERLGIKAIGREIVGADGSCELREEEASYRTVFDPENGGLRQENTFFWEESRK